jgi:DNA replication protein DnaC
MDDLLRLLKTQEISRTSRTRIKRIEESNLVVIDDLMMIANDHVGAGLFFQLVSRLHNQTSVVITSNKGPDEWSQLIGDPALTTAILDRLLHRCEVIYFNDEHSYRMRNRKTIFG